jgi:hypothetical protein
MKAWPCIFVVFPIYPAQLFKPDQLIRFSKKRRQFKTPGRIIKTSVPRARYFLGPIPTLASN